MGGQLLAVFLPVLLFLPFWAFLVAFWLRRRDCPRCGLPLSGIQSPFTKTWRQWVKGGYLCRNCGCETNLAGERVAPSPRPSWLVLGLLLVTPLIPAAGAVLLLFILSRGT
jgi:hypothetical protein